MEKKMRSFERGNCCGMSPGTAEGMDPTLRTMDLGQFFYLGEKKALSCYNFSRQNSTLEEAFGSFAMKFEPYREE